MGSIVVADTLMKREASKADSAVRLPTVLPRTVRRDFTSGFGSQLIKKFFAGIESQYCAVGHPHESVHIFMTFAFPDSVFIPRKINPLHIQ
jgi:hypothetical protein